jgi:hypothetical protein
VADPAGGAEPVRSGTGQPLVLDDEHVPLGATVGCVGWLPLGGEYVAVAGVS